MRITIQQKRLAAPPTEVEIHLTNGVKAVSLRVRETGEDYGQDVILSPLQAEALAYDLLCKAYNVRHEIHDSDPAARGMYAGKLNITEIEALIGLGFDEGAGE